MMKCINRFIIATGIVVLAGLFGGVAAQLPSQQPPSAFLAKYKEKLNGLQNQPVSQAGAQERLPSTQPISVKAIEARTKKALPVVSRPAGPATAKKLPGNAPPPDVKRIYAQKIQVRRLPPLPGN
jgi:hypothetical protein